MRYWIKRLAWSLINVYKGVGGIAYPSLAEHCANYILRQKKFSIKCVDDAGLKTADAIFLRREYELSETPVWSRIESLYKENEKPLILDLGANIGAASLYLSSIFQKANFVCVEPDFKNFEALMFNLEKINSKIYNAAIGPHTGTVCIESKPGVGSNAIRVTSVGNGDVKQITVNEIISDGNAKPFIVKIDIEGYEKQLFEDNFEWLGKFPVILIEIHDWMLQGKETSKPFLRLISELDYDILTFGEMLLCVRFK